MTPYTRRSDADLTPVVGNDGGHFGGRDERPSSTTQKVLGIPVARVLTARGLAISLAKRPRRLKLGGKLAIYAWSICIPFTSSSASRFYRETLSKMFWRNGPFRPRSLIPSPQSPSTLKAHDV